MKGRVMVTLFGKAIIAVKNDEGGVVFDRQMFVNALSKPRAHRIFNELNEKLAFLGDDGIDAIIASGKEDILCELLLFDTRTSDELREYAQAWVTAHQLLEAIQ